MKLENQVCSLELSKKITTEFLQSLNTCEDGIDLVATYEDKDHEAVVRRTGFL